MPSWGTSAAPRCSCQSGAHRVRSRVPDVAVLLGTRLSSAISQPLFASNRTKTERKEEIADRGAHVRLCRNVSVSRRPRRSPGKRPAMDVCNISVLHFSRRLEMCRYVLLAFLSFFHFILKVRNVCACASIDVHFWLCVWAKNHLRKGVIIRP